MSYLQRCYRFLAAPVAALASVLRRLNADGRRSRQMDAVWKGIPLPEYTVIDFSIDPENPDWGFYERDRHGILRRYRIEVVDGVWQVVDDSKSV